MTGAKRGDATRHCSHTPWHPASPRTPPFTTPASSVLPAPYAPPLPLPPLCYCTCVRLHLLINHECNPPLSRHLRSGLLYAAVRHDVSLLAYGAALLAAVAVLLVRAVRRGGDGWWWWWW